MLIAAIADLHGFLPDTPECDVLVVAGDVCPVSGHGLDRQRAWCEQEFTPWLESRPAEAVVGIGGNHDFLFAADPNFAESLPWLYLDNSSLWYHDQINSRDAMFWGSPLSSWFGQWAFMKFENELAEVYAEIPQSLDVLVTHGPAYGACDLAQRRVNAGSQSLRERIVACHPRLHITGHIHEAYGLDRVGDTLIANASCVNARYELVNDPLLFRLWDGGVQQIVS